MRSRETFMRRKRYGSEKEVADEYLCEKRATT